MKKKRCDNEGTARAALRKGRVHRTASGREKKCKRRDEARVVHAPVPFFPFSHTSYWEPRILQMLSISHSLKAY